MNKPEINMENDSFKKKRKYSTDSLEGVIDGETSSNVTKISNDLDVTNVEAFLQESGLNGHLIDKNDKKLIKLNLSSNKFSYDSLPKPKSNLLNITDNEIDDLPSLSDISACTTIVLMPSSSSSLKCTENLLSDSAKSQQNSTSDYSSAIVDTSTPATIGTSSPSSSSSSSSCSSSETSSKEKTDGYDDDDDKDTTLKKKLKKRTFICNECGRQFHSQNDLNKHMLQLHETQKPFECSKCNMAFYDMSSKRRHEKEHSGFKPFRCYICSYEFTRASNLRAHLLKVHSNEIGKTVHITKSIDNKLKFEFNLDEINNNKEFQCLIKNPSTSSNLHATQNILHSKSFPDSNLKDSINNNTRNTVIYIKDPNNKNAEIQHMIVYVDGKPIFVQNPTVQATSTSMSTSSSVDHDKNQKHKKPVEKSLKESKPVAKIPYLLAAAAAAAASNHRQHQQQMQKFQQQNLRLLSTNESTAESKLKNSINNFKPDQEYLNIVSMFKQKNEKLFNPLI